MLVPTLTHHFGNGILNPLATLVKAGALTFALNAIQHFGFVAADTAAKKTTDSIFSGFTTTTDDSEGPQKRISHVFKLGQNPLTDLTNKCEAAFNSIYTKLGFNYCNWLTVCETLGTTICMASPFTRDAALQVLEHKIRTVIPIKSDKSDIEKEKHSHIEDCLSTSDCPDIDENNIHPRAKEATEVIHTTEADSFDWIKNILLPQGWKRSSLSEWLSGIFVPPEWKDVQEVLRFRSDDPREKFLFISAESDHNNALSPTNIAHLLSKLSQAFDLKFQVVKKGEEICEAIDNAKKTGNLVHVLINGHGRPDGIVLDSTTNHNIQVHTITDSISKKIDFKKCFSGIKNNGKILLISCSTGKDQNGDPFDNIAQKMADGAKRVVVAPIHDIYPSKTELLSTEEG